MSVPPEPGSAGEAGGFKSTPGLRRIGRAFGYSVNGLLAAWRHEAAFRQGCLVALAGAVASPFVADTALEWAVLAGSLLLVLAFELLNSAVEALADAVSQARHPLLGRAKDLGSAAVLLAYLVAALLWLGVWLG